MSVRIYSAIFFLCLIWGYLWVPIKISLQTFPPFYFTATRLLIGGGCLILAQILLRESVFPRRNEVPKIIVLSSFMSFGYYGLSTFGMQYVDSGLSAILVYTMPIMMGVLAHYFLAEHLNFKKIIGLGLGLVGIITILFRQLMNLKFDLIFWGELLLLTSAFSWACATVYMKNNFEEYNKVKLTIWQLLIGSVILYLLSYLTEDASDIKWQNPETILYLGYSSVLGTALAFLVWNWIISKIDASLASISIMSVPLIGIFFGYIQLHEKISFSMMCGVFLIIFGIFIYIIKIPIKK